MSRVRRSRIAVGAALAALLLAPRTVADDHEETEARLKIAGVEAPLRAEIVKAIDRAVAYLASRQAPDGAWHDPSLYSAYSSWTDWGATALCALAMRHAGSRAGTDAAHRAMERLRKDTGEGVRRMGRTTVPVAGHLAQTYAASIWLMLLAADGCPAEESRALASSLEKAQDPDSGWWGYALSPLAPGPVNISTSQFAALGLRAAVRSGVEVDRFTWRQHLTGLLRTQTEGGSWAYGAERVRDDVRPGRVANYPYPTATFMGAANLALAIEGGYPAARRKEQPVPPVAVAARERALRRLADEGRALLRAMKEPRPSFDYLRPFGFSYYALYALEKACVFNDVETLGDVRWYDEGARGLIRWQEEDGSWSFRGGRDPLVSTAFALLFLLRSSQAYHPTTPRDVAQPPPAPVTPAAGAPPAK